MFETESVNRFNQCENLFLTTSANHSTGIRISKRQGEAVILLDKNNQNDNSGAQEVPVQCELCGKKYKNCKRLKDHKRFCHPKVTYKCDICSQLFPKKWILETHLRKHTGKFPCLNCGQNFISNNKLQIHCNFYHKNRELSCSYCNAVGFCKKQDLGNHIRTKHTKERAFKCEICDKSFMSSSVYYQHRIIHTKIKKFSCAACSKSFQRKMSLHSHLKIHQNEFPFTCDVCKLVFRRKGDMQKHKINQHSNINQ